MPSISTALLIMMSRCLLSKDKQNQMNRNPHPNELLLIRLLHIQFKKFRAI